MTRDVWLRPNRRILWIAATLFAILSGGGFVLGMVGDGPWRWLGGGLGGASLAVLLALLQAARTPRLAFESGQLLVFLRHDGPIRVPIEHVEVFFLGQGPSHLPRGDDKTSNVVVRIADAAKEWKTQKVSPRLGQWSDGYVTLRGAWVQPIDKDLLHKLNENLKAAHRQHRAQQEESASDTTAG